MCHYDSPRSLLKRCGYIQWCICLDQAEQNFTRMMAMILDERNWIDRVIGQLENRGFLRGSDGLIWINREATLCTNVLQKCWGQQHAFSLLCNFLPFCCYSWSFYWILLSFPDLFFPKCNNRNLCWHLYVFIVLEKEWIT